MPDKHIVIVKWVDAKFCPGIHSKEDILEHNIVGLLFGGHAKSESYYDCCNSWFKYCIVI